MFDVLYLDIDECVADTDGCDVNTTNCENRNMEENNKNFECVCLIGFAHISGNDKKCKGRFQSHLFFDTIISIYLLYRYGVGII